MFASNTSQVSSDATYIEDVFSTYLYTGNGSTQTITNGIDLAGKGGLVWKKQRETVSGGYSNHTLTDTVRGAGYSIFSDTTDQQYLVNSITSFNSDGFSIGSTGPAQNVSGKLYASWTFRKQPKFFDVVTYTGNGVSGRTVSHSLGSVPGWIIIKRTDSTSDWGVMARRSGFTSNYSTGLKLNATNARTSDYDYTLGSEISSTIFPVFIDPDSGMNAYNVNGATYVAYLFAHDAGGFGLTGTDNVISCGSFTTDGSGNATVTLGYEPQWVMVKRTDSVGGWNMMDSMRGMPVTNAGARLLANSSNAETTNSNVVSPSAAGFYVVSGALTASATYIYIAIRRGPMKTPTSGTSVYSVFADGATTNPKTFSAGFPTDFGISQVRSTGAGSYNYAGSRLTGNSQYLVPQTTGAEQSDTTPIWKFDQQNSFTQNISAASMVSWLFRRAPGFFDEVCYTGNSVNGRAIQHNLTVEPELIIIKNRAGTSDWIVYDKYCTAGALRLNTTAANDGLGFWLVTGATASTFTVINSSSVNGSSANTYVAYLFASCPGVSKVGSYTGTGAAQTINCGFAAGARFVLIKRTDSTGDWFVWDTARGIVSGNDPYLLLNSTAAEVTSTDYIDPVSSGFEISSTAPAAINASGGTFIYLAIA